MKDGIEHFSKEDFFYMFFGALFVAMVFILSRNFIEIVKGMTQNHVIAILIISSLLTTIEIYYVGYARVLDRKNRPFSEFWIKRFASVVIVSIITSLFLIYMYGVDSLIGSQNIIKGVVAALMPCSLGATLSDLVKKIKF